MPKIPEHAKKVFQGEIFEVWQWEQKLYDGSSQTFEMLRRADSTIVIAVTEEKTIVITEQMQPNWERPLVSLPGGIVEHDEDALSAAKRELLEETGFASDHWELWREFSPMGKVVRSMWVFIARHARRVSDPTPDAGERITVRTADLDELIAAAFREDFRHMEIQLDLVRAKYDPDVRADLERRLLA
jgi:ADP-ribose pyrophosphatase